MSIKVVVHIFDFLFDSGLFFDVFFKSLLLCLVVSKFLLKNLNFELFAVPVFVHRLELDLLWGKVAALMVIEHFTTAVRAMVGVSLSWTSLWW